MAYKIHVREEAQMDIINAGRWYESRQKGLGERFVSVVENQIEHLSTFAEAFPAKKGNFRELVIKEFPYVIIYIIKSSEVIILAVFNTYLNPNKKP